MLAIYYYRSDLLAPAKQGVLHFVDYAILPKGCNLGQAHAYAIEWADHTKQRKEACIYQISAWKGEALSLTHYIPGREPD